MEKEEGDPEHKKQSRGKKKLRNLEWDLKDGTKSQGLERFDRVGKGKKVGL